MFMGKIFGLMANLGMCTRSVLQIKANRRESGRCYEVIYCLFHLFTITFSDNSKSISNMTATYAKINIRAKLAKIEKIELIFGVQLKVIDH